MSNKIAKTPCCQPGCCPEQHENDQHKMKLVIDFIYLDLNVCAPCQGTDEVLREAVAEVAAVLKTTGVTVEVNKIHITSEKKAIKHKLYTSPTIRINGRDIQMEAKEAICESCGDLCGDEVDCRVWLYQGKEYSTPPKAMIVEAILRTIYGTTSTAPDEPYVLPENLKKFFAAMKKKARAGSPCDCSCKC